MASNPTKIDPIRSAYYEPILLSDKWHGFFFKLSVFLSFIIVYLEKPSDNLQIAFCVCVFIVFGLDIFNRLYLKTRADDMRFKDFLSHSYSIPLHHDQTKDYYNNNETDRIKKLAAQLLENSLHSKSTAIVMAKNIRILTIVYLIIFCLLCLNRSTNLATIALASQVIFSEQILSLLIRIEWTRLRFERVYDDIFSLFLTSPEKVKFEIKTLEALVKYETSKANGGILLSSDIFEANNDLVSKEWDRIKLKLNIS